MLGVWEGEGGRRSKVYMLSVSPHLTVEGVGGVLHLVTFVPSHVPVLTPSTQCLEHGKLTRIVIFNDSTVHLCSHFNSSEVKLALTTSGVFLCVIIHLAAFCFS